MSKFSGIHFLWLIINVVLSVINLHFFATTNTWLRWGNLLAGALCAGAAYMHFTLAFRREE